jgi:hypothetical protein
LPEWEYCPGGSNGDDSRTATPGKEHLSACLADGRRREKGEASFWCNADAFQVEWQPLSRGIAGLSGKVTGGRDCGAAASNTSQLPLLCSEIVQAVSASHQTVLRPRIYNKAES